jgi:kynurenine 3-monooxygenase
MMHAFEGALAYQPYGRDDSECNYSISRTELNRLLITEAEKRGARFRFGNRLTGADFESGRLTFVDDVSGASETIEAEVVFGADGAGSALRAAMQKLEGYREAIEPMSHGYRELLIPAGADGAYRIEKHALHIWPRGRLMLMALPNLDGSFTVTLYLPEEGATSFRELNTPEKVEDLFQRQFPDAIPLIPDLAGSFFRKPAGSLGTVRCHPWHFGGRAVLIGDAAHAIVPFFGQGMNCGFEDCVVLDRLIAERGRASWETVFPEFTRERKPHADAIADMAMENFVEMRDLVGDARFRLRKQVEHRLEVDWPREYRSRYSMVMYGDVPYRVAQEAGRIQQEILDELCDGLDRADELDGKRARRLIGEKLKPFLEHHAVDLTY